MQSTTELLNTSEYFVPEMSENQFDEPKKFRWTKEEYYQMADAGLFNNKRVELIEGEVYVKYSHTMLGEEETKNMSAMSGQHFSGVNLVAEVLRDAFKKDHFVSVQCPINMGDISEPEPDISVIKGKIRDFNEAIPTSASLLVEVADTSLLYDRSKKVSLYAKNGIQDYWILNLKDRRLEVYRRPIKDKNAFYGFNYGDRLIFTEEDSVSPLANPKAKIKIADILP